MTENSIAFPNLNIMFENVGDHISVLGFDIAFYGMVIGLGVLAGVCLACYVAKKTGQNLENYFDLAIIGIIVSIIGARVYYVIFAWDNYKNDLLSIINIREGGLAIYGGIIGAILTVIVYSKVKKKSMLLIFDTVCFGLPIGQAIGRWGNFFNREVFGEYTNGLLAMRIPVSAVRSSDVSELMRENMQTIEGVNCIQVQPTFLYESLVCLLIVVLLLLYRKHKKFDGELFLIYMGAYGIGRFFIEGIRTDQLFLGNTTIPVSQALAAIFAVVSIALIIAGHIKTKKNKVLAR
ncbi:MAG: prolipoprotein diacylglyceryl transferase [Suipraeoptans sp.]